MLTIVQGRKYFICNNHTQKKFEEN